MSTYSTNLALELIAQGDQAGSWGITTNTNLGTLIEQAISGYVQYPCTGGTDTITIPNGTTGVARNMYLELTGTGGGTLQVPANKTKLYFVYNSTAAAVTVKVTGQTGVSVPAGAKMSLVSNGTDVVNAVNYFASLTLGGLSLTSALPVASGGTGSTTAGDARTALDVPSRAGSGASGTWGISISGNAATVTNGITTGNIGTYAPSLTGTGASGTWGIDISGNAATVTNGITTGNIGSYAPGLTGSGASGTWGISITGNAATVTNGITTSNIGSYAPGLTGSGASGTWGISITGNAATVTNGITTGNIGTYAPTPTGGGASGSWGIDITGNAATVTSVSSNISGMTGDTVGSLIFAANMTNNTYVLNDTVAGSNLSPSGEAGPFQAIPSGTYLSGSWRCLGHAPGSVTTKSNTYYCSTLWVRYV